MKKTVNISYRSILSLFSAGLISLAVATSCNNETSTETKADSTTTTSPESTASESKSAQAVVTGTKSDTTVTGLATFTQEGNGKVKMEFSVEVPKMANRSVAVHFHEHGDCGEAGMNTHGHWNPTGKPHGKWGEGDFHSGDIGNVTLDASGKGTVSVETDLWSLGGSDATKDILNKAIIVHSGVDDYKSQPSGNAGSRIGCGLIEKK